MQGTDAPHDEPLSDRILRYADDVLAGTDLTTERAVQLASTTGPPTDDEQPYADPLRDGWHGLRHAPNHHDETEQP
jgi:hypothetical protein